MQLSQTRITQVAAVLRSSPTVSSRRQVARYPQRYETAVVQLLLVRSSDLVDIEEWMMIGCDDAGAWFPLLLKGLLSNIHMLVDIPPSEAPGKGYRLLLQLLQQQQQQAMLLNSLHL